MWTSLTNSDYQARMHVLKSANDSTLKQPIITQSSQNGTATLHPINSSEKFLTYHSKVESELIFAYNGMVDSLTISVQQIQRNEIPQKTSQSNYYYRGLELAMNPFYKTVPQSFLKLVLSMDHHCDFFDYYERKRKAGIFSQDFEELEKEVEHHLSNSHNLENLRELWKILINVEWAMAFKESFTPITTDIKFTKVLVNYGINNKSVMYEMRFKALPDDRLKQAAILTIFPGICVPKDENPIWASIQKQIYDPTTNEYIVLLLTLHSEMILTKDQPYTVYVEMSDLVYNAYHSAIERIDHSLLPWALDPKITNSPISTDFKIANVWLKEASSKLWPGSRTKFDYEQRKAIVSIVHGIHEFKPYVLYGPPGTGKTVTIVESIKQLLIKDHNYTILVCTPSRMARNVVYDKIKEEIIQQDILAKEEVFVMRAKIEIAAKRIKNSLTATHEADSDSLTDEFSDEEEEFESMDHIHIPTFLGSRIVLCTLECSYYLCLSKFLNSCHFSHIFIDEAGQTIEPACWIPIGGLAHPRTRIIFSGDIKQLGPYFNTKYILNHLPHAKNPDYNDDRIDSYMKRLIDSEEYKNDERLMTMLKNSYRCYDPIIRFSSEKFYGNQVVSARKLIDKRLLEWIQLPNKEIPLIFHSVNHGREELVGERKTYSNEQEASIVAGYVNSLLAANLVKAEEIGIISPYTGQKQLLLKLLCAYPDITIESVERFQGSERRVIIITTVRTTKLGFLEDHRRLNTALTRAQELLIVVGNVNSLSRGNTWSKFIQYCRRNRVLI